MTDRNRYVDLVRVLCSGIVVYAHWLMVSITYEGGQLSGVNAIYHIPWGPQATLVFQIMPVFFLVGGYVNARSWPAHQAGGQTWTAWVRRRALRLLWPTAVFTAVGVAAVSSVLLAGGPGRAVGVAARMAFLHLWFLPVYLMLAALTPLLLAAHRRWGLLVPVVMAAGAAAVSAIGPHMQVIGFANYLLVWGSAHQWGFAWHDGIMTRRRWLPYAMLAGGAAVLACLVVPGLYEVNMVAPGNTQPPSVAFLAFALGQCGLALALEPVGARIMRRTVAWRCVRRLNTTLMSVYLWHFVPVFIVAVALYPTGVLPQPPVGSPEWWVTRLPWFAALTVVLAAMVAGLTRAQRPLRRIPAGIGPTGPWSPVLLLAGIAAVIFGLARLDGGGPAPEGRLPVLVLIAFTAGLLAIFASGRPHGRDEGPAQSPMKALR